MSTGTAVSKSTARRARDACLCLHVQRAARATARAYDAALRPVGLTNGQFSLLAMLSLAGNPAIGEVAAFLAMDRTTLTANLKPLLRRGVVGAAVDESDRRSRRLRLTPKGRKLLAEALPLWTRAQASAARRLARSDPGRLRAGLRALS